MNRTNIINILYATLFPLLMISVSQPTYGMNENNVNQNICTIADLPDDCISLITAYCSPIKRNNLRSVSQQWLTCASPSNKFFKSDNVSHLISTNNDIALLLTQHNAK